MSTKLNLFLDLDQTLISAEKPKHLKSIDPSVKNNFVSHNMDGSYEVFERPGLQKFLTYIFENFNVSIWTAASKDYAMFIINNIIIGNHKNRKLNYVLFSYHCDISQHHSENGCTKDLRNIWKIYKVKGYNEQNTIILDDYFEDVYEKQKNNCIIAPEFKIISKEPHLDTFLSDLIPMLRDYNKNSETLAAACNNKFNSQIL
jgi:hypothetical protein